MDFGVHRRLRAAIIAGLFGLVSDAAMSQTSMRMLDFADLEGWAEDDHTQALSVFLNTCRDMKNPDWVAVCAAAKDVTDGKQFFELLFRPVLIGGEALALFTGYYEPELRGALQPGGDYQYPLYAMPAEAKTNQPWLSRRELYETGVLKDRNLEIAWVDDPVELFFLQIQGSGRIRLPDGNVIRVGYGGKNGHPYRSIGQELVRRAIYEPHQVSAAVIKSWVRTNAEEGKELLYHNPSYVFFREVSHVPAEEGPLGAMNRSITAHRSVAIDPTHVPLGAPVWIEKKGTTPINRLMVAQDTGSAIKGPQRADIFFGTGEAAGMMAGRIRDPGRVVVLMPIQRAYALVPDTAP